MEVFANHLISILFGSVLTLLIVTRSYRGLHYLHDFIGSIIIALIVHVGVQKMNQII